MFFHPSLSKSRVTHQFKLQRFKPRGTIDKYAFTQRSIPQWNILPAHIVNAKSEDIFRRLNEGVLSEICITFGLNCTCT